MKHQYKQIPISRDHPFYLMADKRRYISEHRLIMAEELGRPLTKKEIVHHIDNNPSNNNPNNLQVMTQQQHLWLTRRDMIKITIIRLDQDKRQLEKDLKAISRRLKELGLE